VSYSVAEFDDDIKNIETLASKTEKIFVSVSPEEKASHDKDNVDMDRITSSIEYQRR
jgi:hypothetical protein